jgi:hypothetical protein
VRDLFFFILKMPYPLIFLLFLYTSSCMSHYQRASPEQKFPWPPPKPSADCNIDNKYLIKPNETVYFLNIATLLEEALNQAGYGQKRYYLVCTEDSLVDGFAIVTQLEQTELNRMPKQGSDRWAQEYRATMKFDLRHIIAGLFNARRGLYRIIVFVIAPTTFAFKNKAVTEKDVKNWFAGGMIRLPNEVENFVYSTSFRCTALIYEFEQSAPGQEARLIVSEYTGQQHLEKGGIWKGLTGQ